MWGSNALIDNYKGWYTLSNVFRYLYIREFPREKIFHSILPVLPCTDYKEQVEIVINCFRPPITTRSLTKTTPKGELWKGFCCVAYTKCVTTLGDDRIYLFVHESRAPVPGSSKTKHVRIAFLFFLSAQDKL